MIDNSQLWNTVLENLKSSMSKPYFSMWLKDSSIVKQEEGIISVGVPSVFAREWLSEKFHKQILKALREVNDNIRGIEYVITDAQKKKMLEKRAQAEQLRRESVKDQQGKSRELPLDDLYVNKEDNLNPRYTFDSFVVGPFNELAHAASLAVIAKPGGAYNPLFIYGDTGRGKTHLIQAVGNRLKQLYPGKKIFYITSERFANDFIMAVQNNRSQQFKEKYRFYDVIIMDDVQFFSNKEKSQEELFHLFNHFYDNNKQIIFSSDKHPQYIQNLEERIKSRFNAGMIVDIPAPDFESRCAILRTKSRINNLGLSEEVVVELARVVEGNIRELEGALNSIMMHTQLKGIQVAPHEIKNIIKTASKPAVQKNVSIKDVIRIVSQFYDVEEKDIFDKSRKKEVVKPRQMIMYILREDFDVSYPSIGEKLGGRDHTTVIHSCEKIKEEIKTNPSVISDIERIRSIIQY
ncbi:MAG TPA: chromosomal replication initiator protein DnaA [Candidatus Paceibacterota bacterium]|nr:chromosomal replication initiator protein DnaA [Candidatus Paceibacterota bacterium]